MAELEWLFFFLGGGGRGKKGVRVGMLVFFHYRIFMLSWRKIVRITQKISHGTLSKIITEF